MQKLSKRLQAAADYVTKGNRAADIGTDHGFLPIYLVQSGRCPQAVAMDIRKGPLLRAQEHIAAAGLEHVIQVRLSDGLQELAEGEADSAVITGMGGLSVIHILEEAQAQLAWLKELVLEPQSDIAKVRRYLREHHLYIDRENLVYEAGKFYPVLHVVTEKKDLEESGRENRQQMRRLLLEKLVDEERLERLLDEYGACIIYGRHPLLGKLLERDEKRALAIAHAVCGQPNAKERKREVEKSLEEIRILRDVVVYMDYGEKEWN